jgi:PPOX class probable F420-dependent enzyme
MRRGLRPEDLGDLFESTLSCTLATYRRSGDVLLSPVWFNWREGGFDLVVGRDDAKARHVRRDPRASVVLYENGPPLRGIEVHGRAELFEAGLGEVRLAMWKRYTGGEPAGDDEGEIGLRVTGDIRAWDFADDFEFGTLA